MTTLPPSARLWQLATAHFLPRCLHVVAELGVADHLGDTPATAEALAAAAGANADALERMLRLLAVAGIFDARGTVRRAFCSISRPSSTRLRPPRR